MPYAEKKTPNKRLSPYDASQALHADKKRAITARREFGIFLTVEAYCSVFKVESVNAEESKLVHLGDYMGDEAPDWQGVVVERCHLPPGATLPTEHDVLEDNLENSLTLRTTIGDTSVYDKSHLAEVQAKVVSKLKTDAEVLEIDESQVPIIPAKEQEEKEGEELGPGQKRRKLKKQDSEQSFDYSPPVE